MVLAGPQDKTMALNFSNIGTEASQRAALLLEPPVCDEGHRLKPTQGKTLDTEKHQLKRSVQQGGMKWLRASGCRC